jgi:L-fucose isomerase-like protein
MRDKGGELLDCLLTADLGELAVAIRPFRALHHLREAKILDVTARDLPAAYVKAVKEKFGTEIIQVTRDQALAAYHAIPDTEAEAEARRWMRGARKIVEPTRDEIVRSCRLALASQKLLDDHDATMITIDCYGTMWRQLPAYPCIGHARLNSLGLGGMCESDLQSCMTQILLQGLSGKPGFVNDPTMDTARNAIILAHCMGTPKMDGPDGATAPSKLRTIMERQEGCVCQVFMSVGKRATTAELMGTDTLLYFTGEIIEAPDLQRGCRTKITVRVDGDAAKLWQNWTDGLHRVTCYGNLKEDLQRFCRFMGIAMVNEA